MVSFTETWLLEGISDSELFDGRYMVWRRDRNYQKTQEKYGGGVLLAVSRNYSALARPEWSSSAEDIWVSVTLNINHSGHRKVHICTLYLCSENRGNSYNTQLTNFSDKLSQIISSCPNDTFIIMGDFNLSNIDWVNNPLVPICVSGASQIHFVDTIAECGLEQFNSSRNANNRILDLVLSNIELKVAPCGDPLVAEDVHHRSLVIDVSLSSSKPLKDNSRKIYFYNIGNYEKINASLEEIDWKDCLAHNSFEGAVGFFYNKLYELREDYIPHKLTYPTNFPPWYNSSLRKILKEKRKFLLKYRKYGNSYDYHTFSLLRMRTKIVEDQCYRDYLNMCENRITENPKQFWSFVKNNKSGNNSLPSTLTYAEQSAETGESICNLFAKYFQSTFLSSSDSGANSSVLPGDCTRPYEYANSINNIEIDDKTLYTLLKAVDLNKGPGPDEISPVFISMCAAGLTIPLSILFKRSLGEGVVPQMWKSAFITPIHKNGDRGKVANYRPISKLCIFAKILERIVHTQVYNSLASTFIPEQHGFLKNRSTASNLLTFVDRIALSMDSGSQVDAIFTDYTKAFDRIDHYILLQKLLAAGIHGNLFRWFTSYINNRSQAVAINGFVSSWHGVPSGVPQGSLIGPLLFNIFINDVNTCFTHSNFLLYADDLKIFKPIDTINDSLLLQQDLDRFEKYCAVNKLELNLAKCQFITFTRKQNIIEYNYTIKNCRLDKVSEIKDLGVIHDHKLSYDAHIGHISNKANRMMGFVLRSCSQFTNLKTLKILYCSYVRSILEYSSQLWNPQYDVYINRLELIQRKFMRFLQYKCKTFDTNYEARCKRHHILPLEVRRKIADTTLLAKIAQSKIDSSYLLSKLQIRVPHRSVRHQTTFAAPRCFTNYRRNSFFIRSVTSFNQLTDFPNLDIFNTKPISFNKFLTDHWFESVP